MEFVPADQVDTEAIANTGLEIATVSVIWREGDNHPVIDYTGCSGFEAEALMRGAVKRLAKANAKCMVFLEEDLEYEDEEEDEDADPDD